MFGFTVYNSIYQNSRERFLEKHVGVIVGYDDQIKIKNTNCGLETTGALLIRNSWRTRRISKRLVDFI